MDPSFRLELGRRALLGDHVLANLAQHLGQLFGHLLGPLCLANGLDPGLKRSLCERRVS